MVCLAFAYVICFPPRFRFNISGINIRNMDVQAYIWNHKCVNITQSSLLLLFKLLCVDHCITEGLRSLTSPPPKLMLLRSARSGKANFCHVRDENIVRNPIVPVPMTRAVNYEDALRKLTSVLNKKQADSLVPRSIWRSSMLRTAGAARRQWPNMDTCKKCGNVRFKRRKLMSPGHWFFPELRCQSGSSVLNFPTY